jgi:uncharacterized membrane protein YhiD involved in acid resistance
MTTKILSRLRTHGRALELVIALVLLCSAAMGDVSAQTQPPPASPFQVPVDSTSDSTPPTQDQLKELKHAAMRLPLAAALAAVLAFRPRRRGTPPRQPAVIQTQIILAVIGGLVMLVVGSSLARAFGIVGAAGLVRYRAKVNDPKDASVMLSTLAIGLAAGVGLWLLALFGTAFFMLVLWLVESAEPKAVRRIGLKIKAKDVATLKPKVERLLERLQSEFEIRAVTPDELHYEVKWPFEKSTDSLSERIVALDPDDSTEVVIELLKEKS